jgi:two-component sensor histidine kinase
VLIRLFRRYLNLGTQGKTDANELRRIRTANLLNFIVALYLVISYTKYFILGDRFNPIPSTVFLLFAIAAFAFSFTRRSTAAFFVFSLNINAAVLFFNLYYPTESGPYLFYFPLAVSTILLNIPYVRNTQSLFYLGVFILCFVARFIVHVPGLRMDDLSAIQVETIWYYDFSMAVFVTGILSFMLAHVILEQNKEIVSQNRHLVQAQEELAVALREKEILLAELHHRIKNNLAIISSLLNLQLDGATQDESRKLLTENRNRIQSMALVHRMLYENPVLKKIELGKYASSLIGELFFSYNLKHVEIFEDYDQISLPVEKSVPLGLIINEFVTNSIKYVYKGTPASGSKFLSTVKVIEEQVHFCMKDSGEGFPKDFNERNESLGIFLIRSLAEQLDGKVLFSNDGGARIDLRFPIRTQVLEAEAG